MKTIVALLGILFFLFMYTAIEAQELLAPAYTDEYPVIFDRDIIPNAPGVVEIFVGVKIKTILNKYGVTIEVCAILTEEFLLDYGEPVPTDDEGVALILLDDELTYLGTEQLFIMVEKDYCPTTDKIA